MSTIDFTEQLNGLQLFLYNFALRLTNNQEAAKDLVQETSMKAFRYKEKFQVGTNFKGWIATIMRNTFITNYRKKQKNRTVSEPVEELAYGLESTTILSNQAEVNLRLQELMKMFDEISDLYTVPFLLHYRGYEYQEIAEQLQLPIGTIKSRIFTARQKMKDLIESRYEAR
ncbi:RNA polymerase sigma factor [Lewinella sp. LCG006]|uniref:RNA polymerase sigma factor n=1 Tax=Lewinella sp. LCG006 TaxID=3231911 RepID=UPI0034608E59